MKDAISVMNFPVSTLKSFPYLWAKRSFCGLFRIGESSERINGFNMNKHAMSALNAAIKSSGVL